VQREDDVQPDNDEQPDNVDMVEPDNDEQPEDMIFGVFQNSDRAKRVALYELERQAIRDQQHDDFLKRAGVICYDIGYSAEFPGLHANQEAGDEFRTFADDMMLRRLQEPLDTDGADRCNVRGTVIQLMHATEPIPRYVSSDEDSD
jgi:serine/threonine protein kinase HipA of HipAB toxin-antitoxin module